MSLSDFVIDVQIVHALSAIFHEYQFYQLFLYNSMLKYPNISNAKLFIFLMHYIKKLQIFSEFFYMHELLELNGK